MGAQISYTVEDGKGETSVFFVNIPSTFTLAQSLEAAQDIATLVNAVITGAIRSIGLCFNVTLPGGLTTTPDADADVEEGARFQWLSTGNFRTRFRLPTFNEDLILAGTKQVDLTDTDVDALVDAIIGGTPVTGSGTVTFVDSRDVDIIALDTAREAFGKDRG